METQRKITDRKPLIAIAVISAYFSIPNTYFLVQIGRKLKLKIGIEEIERKFRLLAWAIQVELFLYIVGASLYLYQAGRKQWQTESVTAIILIGLTDLIPFFVLFYLTGR
jgi:hypothetical protein